MGKLGKKARKFAKKNLQSVLKKNRKLKSIIKRTHSSRDKGNAAEVQEIDTVDISNRRNFDAEDVADFSLDSIFSEDDSVPEDASDSEGSLSEDPSCPYVPESDRENDLDDSLAPGSVLGKNREIRLELAKQRRKLNRLREKDPEFSKFLESRDKDLDQKFGNVSSDDEDEENSWGLEALVEYGYDYNKCKLLTSSTIDSWCQLILEQNSMSAFTNLLNGYRAACHHGSDLTSSQRIRKSETYCKILMFILHNADHIFQRQLGITSSNCRRESILEMKNTSEWKNVKPMIKSYLRSTLFLLNQVTSCEILAFALAQLRASIIFFAAFPSLLQKLIKIAVHLWATGGGPPSSSSFLVIRDVVCLSSVDYFDTCLIKMYKAFITCCKFVEPSNLEHIQYLQDSFVELCSLDLQKSFNKALVSVQQLAKILQHGLKTKNKETFKKIYNWQYINCIDLWVKFISVNMTDHNLQPLLYLIVQVIYGVAHLFPAPKYFPLRLKCVQMLNQLSSCTGVFIPITSLVLDFLEYRGSGKADAQPEKLFDFSSFLKVPKYCLKSQEFQKACISSAIDLLTAHFAQWSYHISFPELATVALLRLRKFHEKTSIESGRRAVKCLIDQIQLNVEFVQKEREGVAFSPKDQEAVEAFLQLEKCSRSAPFAQYYYKLMQKCASQTADLKEKISVPKEKTWRKRKQWLNRCGTHATVNGERSLEKGKISTSDDGRRDGRISKKQRV